MAAASGIITTLAGTGDTGYNGDGIPAASARLNYPTGVAVDDAGNVYIADFYNARIRLVQSNGGTISTVAGTTGFGGFNGDGPIATAQLNRPSGVAVDGDGNIVIADWGNNRVRRIAAYGGTLVTIAGNGTPGFSGDGPSASLSTLNGPFGVATDGAGIVCIADSGNNRVRQVFVPPGNGSIVTLAGSGGDAGYNGDGIPATSAALRSPTQAAANAAGTVYIADTYNNRIRAVFPNGTIATLAGTGAAGYSGDGSSSTAAALNSPTGVIVDARGGLRR